jgi:phosphotransferase system HPr (HPr) family protein
MEELRIVVKNETGLHSRPADLFVRTAKLYESNITVKKNSKFADAKSILKVILLNVKQNDEILVCAEGNDEYTAIQDLKKLIESDFKDVNERVTI